MGARNQKAARARCCSRLMVRLASGGGVLILAAIVCHSPPAACVMRPVRRGARVLSGLADSRLQA